MKNKGIINKVFQNNTFVFFFSLVISLVVWVVVVVNFSSQSERVIKDVKVSIDNTVPSQFNLEVFGNDDFKVDVTVKGKRYLISNLTADDISVTALTNSVNAAGVHNLQLSSSSENAVNGFTISSVSQKSVEVYFDTPKTIEVPIETNVTSSGISIAAEGFASGEAKPSETSVTISGPAAEINRIHKVVANYEITTPLVSNLSVDTSLVPLDENGKNDFLYLQMSSNKVVLTIPVFKIKTANAVVTFKNAPDNYVATPLEYTITPDLADFEILVDEYDKTTAVSVGTVDFKNLYPGNNEFVFSSSGIPMADNSVSEFKVSVNLDGYSQEHFTVSSNKFIANNPGKLKYQISGLNKAVTVVGKTEELEKITEDMISVEVDLSNVTYEKGTSVTVPAIVTVENPACWICGTYTIEINF